MEQKLLDLIINIGQVRGWAVDVTDNGNDQIGRASSRERV